MQTPWVDHCSTSTLLDSPLDSRVLLPIVDLVEDLPVEVVVVAVEQPWLKVRLSSTLSKRLMDAVALLETTGLSGVESIELDLAIGHLSNLLDLLVATKIDRLTMSRSDMLDHCRYPP